MRIPLQIGALAVPLALVLAACGEQKQAQQAPPPPSVTVVQPVKRTVFDYDEYVGRFAAVNSVEIRARVSGYLDKVDFTDGQRVKQGDLLFTIDKRSFQNELAQARANLTLAKSNLTFTEGDFQRAQQLVKDKTITEQAFDQRSQAHRNAQASFNANEAQVRQAELNLQFTELRAPIDGRIGDRRVSPGNLVAGGTGGNTATLLATIVSLDPIYFEFTFDEASLLRYERTARSAQKLADGTKIALKLIDENDYEHAGRMDFINNVIDPTTGTIRGRGVFANPKGLFTPGMFATVRVPGSPPYEALLIPDAAIGTEQTRKFVLVVGADNKVAQKYVTVGQTTDDNLRVIKTGIGPDDRIITEGLMRARPGMTVAPHAPGEEPGKGGAKDAAKEAAKPAAASK
jgi:RND family efflux transporter MFP subunit